ncbi:MAG: hypothetical protein WCV73_04360 [Patescibacteria group bacterium]|jgi:hypothetical protein
MKRLKIKIFGLVGLLGILALVGFAQGQENLGANNVGDILNRLTNTAIDSQIIQKGQTQPSIYNFIARFVNLFLAFLGTLFLAIIAYAGFNWMMAKGNAASIESAIKLMENGSIGVIIVILAYLLSNFVVFKIIGISVSP